MYIFSGTERHATCLKRLNCSNQIVISQHFCFCAYNDRSLHVIHVSFLWPLRNSQPLRRTNDLELVSSKCSKVDFHYFASHDTLRKLCLRIQERDGKAALQRHLAWLQRPPRFNSLRWNAKTIFSLFFENWKCEQKCSKHCNMDFSGQRTAYNTYTCNVHSCGNWLACHCSYGDRICTWLQLHASFLWLLRTSQPLRRPQGQINSFPFAPK